jgi:excisionase family DNA binding protein
VDLPAEVVAVVMFAPEVARDLYDALRLLEGRLAGTSRRLAPGTVELRRLAERSVAIRSAHPLTADVDDAHDDDVLGLLTYEDVAARLRVSEPTVRRWAAAGTLPVVHIGRSARVKPADLAAFIDALPTERRAAAGVVVLPGRLDDTADRVARRRGLEPS